LAWIQICLSNFTCFVGGAPIPQGSKKAFVRGGRVSLVEANDKLKPWRKTVTETVSSLLLQTEPCAHAVEVELLFVMPRPKSVTRQHMTVKPDLDKLTRAVFDGVTDSGLWVDDSQVIGVLARKTYEYPTASPGVHILIRHAEKIS
jgi:Holliday junction resolvase RusA-like endonuclease